MNASAESTLERAVTLLGQGARVEAAALCQGILAADPRNDRAINVLGMICLGSNEPAQAAHHFQQALELASDNALYWSNLVAALCAGGRLDQALAAAGRCLEAAPDAAASHNLLGDVHHRRGEIAHAADCFQRAFHLAPTAYSAHRLGNHRKMQRRYAEAIAWLRKAIELDPRRPNAYLSLSSCLIEIGRFEEGKAVCESSVRQGFANPDIYSNLGAAEAGLLRFADAVDAYEHALRLDSNHPATLSNMANCIAHLCDWERTRKYHRIATDRVLEAIDADGDFRMMPFTALTIDLAPGTQRRIAEHWIRKGARAMPARFSAPEHRARRERIVLGYLSSDFRYHPVMHLAKTLFQRHDRDRFVVICYSCGPDDGSDYRKHVERTCDTFVDIRSLDTEQVIARVLADRIDILVDMTGHTALNRLDVLAHKPAPVQVHFLGYPGTLGAPYVDYFVTDRYLSPPGSEVHFQEKLVYMPDTYQVSDDMQQASDISVSRTQAGLPEAAFVFASFNSSYKIDSRIFDCWMAILERTPGSVLWLLAPIEAVVRNLRQAAEQRGVDPARLVFARYVDRPRHLARHVLADLFLDTWIVCGHTTSSDALRMGVPVITSPRVNFVSRVTGTLLNAHGLDELICEDLNAYTELAIHLAHDSERLATLRQRLAPGREYFPARDTTRFARNLERAYTRMMDLHWAGLPPEPIDVAALPAVATGQHVPRG
ncbi:MAG: tetratricopeptide repeat protein [Burkholderiales bacterium]|nr:tetratricopeptide repeat protein [Burkholderiales bacterium]